jgi:hypothetical protein
MFKLRRIYPKRIVRKRGEMTLIDKIRFSMRPPCNTNEDRPAQHGKLELFHVEIRIFLKQFFPVAIQQIQRGNGVMAEKTVF